MKKDDWTYSLNTQSTFNWDTRGAQNPMNATVAKLVKFGDTPVSLSVGARYYLRSVPSGPSGEGSCKYYFYVPKINMSASNSPVSYKPEGDRTSLAVKRTLMAADRTLMAWLRTALSMISFGFTIYKILQGFQELEGYELANKFDARVVGEFLVGMGTLAMVMGTVEYWFIIRDLSHRERIRVWIRPAFVMSLVISLAGLVIFTGLFVKLI